MAHQFLNVRRLRGDWRRRRTVRMAMVLALLGIAALLYPQGPHAVSGTAPRLHAKLTGTACNSGGGGAAASPITVGMASTPDGNGYWLVRQDGGIFPYGDAPGIGSAAGKIQTPVVAMAATPSGRGYWIVERRGMVWTYGDAGCYGGTYDTGATDIVGIAPSPDGRGYQLVEQDGGIWPFGDAGSYGCIPCQKVTLNDVVGIAETPDGGGYWIVEADGGIWPYGNACGCGRAFPAFSIVAIVKPPGSSQGYFMIGKDGGVFTFGSASGYLGSEAGHIPGNNVTGAALTMEGHGMWFSLSSNTTVGLGDAGTYQ